MKNKKTQKELFGMLQNIGNVYSNKWDMVKKIVSNINDTEVLNKEWCGFYTFKNDNPEYYPLDLSKIETWSTYDNKCIDLKFSLDNNQLICDVLIYREGNRYNGREERKFKAKLLFKNKFINELSDLIEYKFNNFLDNQYDIFLENKKQEWIENLRKEFLESFKNK